MSEYRENHPYREEQPDDTDFDPIEENYTSITSRINVGPRKTFNQKRLDEHLEKIYSEGWYEIYDFKDFEVKDRIRYINELDKFVVGGWVTKVEKSEGFLMWRTTTMSVWSLQYANIKRAWTRKPLLPVSKKKDPTNTVPKYKYPVEEGKYEVLINDKVVFRTNDKSKATAFKSTRKYENALRNGFTFS